MKVFIDTAPLIYLIEGKEEYRDRVETQLNQWLQSGFILTTSSLTLMEILVVPKKSKNDGMVQKYRALLENLMSEPLIPLDAVIAEEAAGIRVAYGFKTPDSIQLASARHRGSDIFYTNDLNLQKFADLTVLSVDR